MEELKIITPRRPDMAQDLIFQISGIALLGLLFIAFFTGEEYAHTHVMIGYAITSLFAIGLFWAIVRPRLSAPPQEVYSLRGFNAQFQNTDKLSKLMAAVFLLMVALPLCALILMLLTHTIWGAEKIDEIHEVVAYFAVGMVVVYVTMVVIASIGHVDSLVRNLLRGKQARP
jgi:cytochrome b